MNRLNWGFLLLLSQPNAGRSIVYRAEKISECPG